MENLWKVFVDTKKDASQVEASIRSKISRSILRNKLFGKHQGDSGTIPQ